MAVDLRTYQIFLSSPSGLDAERSAIREFIEKYNKREANCRNVHFLVICWQDLPLGYGRPQDFINEKLRDCDYFILILWDRWGSSPGAGQYGDYASGTEEEFDLAVRCYEDENHPMRDVAVYFKNVDNSRLRHVDDDGDFNEEDKQLRKVLDFKKQLAQGKRLFYGEFNDKNELADRIWTQLAQWKRDHEDRFDSRGVKSVHDIAQLPERGQS